MILHHFESILIAIDHMEQHRQPVGKNSAIRYGIEFAAICTWQ
jgi:hypothetical protein